MPAPPTSRIHTGSAAFCATSPPDCTMLTTAASGPMPLATSFEPCAKAIAQAVNSIIGTNTFSTLAKWKSRLSSATYLMRSISTQPMPAIARPISAATPKLAATDRSTLRCLSPFHSVTSEITKPTRKM